MKKCIATLMALIACLAMVSILLAAEPIKPKTLAPSVTPSVAQGKARGGDWSLKYISAPCGCGCSESWSVDAAYINKIVVKACKFQTSSDQYDLRVTYFDLTNGRNVDFKYQHSISGSTPEMPSCEDIIVLSTPALIKKSSGIKAEIKSADRYFLDSDMSNNIAVISPCQGPN